MLPIHKFDVYMFVQVKTEALLALKPYYRLYRFPTNKQSESLKVQIWKKKKQSIEKFADFQEFRGFSIYERKSDLGVNYDKLCDTIVTILASGVKDQKTSKLSQHKLKQAVL